jgi:hypothetical protein
MRRSYRNFGTQRIGIEPAQAEVPSSLRTIPMLISLKFTSATIFLLVGVFLLDSPVSGPDTNQIALLLGGATLVSLGLLTTLLTVKDWLVWKRHYKNGGGRDHG